MPLDAGAVPTADELDRLRPRKYYQHATSDLAIGNTNQPIPGASITLDTETNGAEYEVTAWFDCDAMGTGSTSAAVGLLRVDGVDQTAQAVYQADSASATGRATVSQSWDGTLSTAGSHTFQLRGTTPGSGSNGVEMNATHTRFRVKIQEVV